MSRSCYTEQYAALSRDGFVVVRELAEPAVFARLRSLAVQHLQARVEPLELEADLNYPGAPRPDSPGAATVRRLLDAYGRGEAFQQWASASAMTQWLQGYFQAAPTLSLVHHNCVMTKHPSFGTATGWHQDLRYWSFTQGNLVSSWLALGHESAGNGGLWLIPGSHAANFSAECFDEKMFFRTDVPANQPWLATAVCPVLEPGDVVFFHCRTLHAARRNESEAVKLSLVHTYHPPGCAPVPGSRSASRPEIEVGTA